MRDIEKINDLEIQKQKHGTFLHYITFEDLKFELGD